MNVDEHAIEQAAEFYAQLGLRPDTVDWITAQAVADRKELTDMLARVDEWLAAIEAGKREAGE